LLKILQAAEELTSFTYMKSALRTFYELQLFLIHLKFFY